MDRSKQKVQFRDGLLRLDGKRHRPSYSEYQSSSKPRNSVFEYLDRKLYSDDLLSEWVSVTPYQYCSLGTLFCFFPTFEITDFFQPNIVIFPKDDTDHFTQVGIQSSQVGQSSLTFNHWSVPFYSCQGSECTAYAWTAASGTSRFTLTAELTDNCLHIASDYSSDPSSQPAVDFIELIVNF